MLPPHTGAVASGVRVAGAEQVASLRSARDLIDLRFAEPIGLDPWRPRPAFSKFHFARAFKDTYGETPANYLTRRGVERAKDLLRSANLTATEVCMLVGFSSLGSFISRFAELFGMSPSTFRQTSAATRRGPHPSRAASSWSGAGAGLPARADDDAGGDAGS